MSASSPRAWKEGVGVVLPPAELPAEELVVPLIGKEEGRMMASLISVRPVVVPEASVVSSWIAIVITRVLLVALGTQGSSVSRSVRVYFFLLGLLFMY